jgi:hypothetical protein
MATKQNNKMLIRSIKTLSIILKHFGEFSLRNGCSRAIFFLFAWGLLGPMPSFEDLENQTQI